MNQFGRGHDGPGPGYAHELSRLIDQLRNAQAVAGQLEALAPAHEAQFAKNLTASIADLLGDLGCCD